MKDEPLHGLLVQELLNNQQEVVVVQPGPGFAQKRDGYTIDPTRADDYTRLFGQLLQSHKMPARILQLWYFDRETGQPLNVESFQTAQYMGFYCLLFMIQALGRKKYQQDLHITLISSYLHRVLGNEPLVPAKAPVLGLLKVIPQEHPNITCMNIDLLPPEGALTGDGQWLTELWEELTTRTHEPIIALRHHQRWVQSFEPLSLPASRTTPLVFKERGVYLITGGLGNIGFMFAELLVKAVGARIIMTGRSSFPAKKEWQQYLKQNNNSSDRTTVKIKKLQELEAAGGEILYFQADCADLAAMQRVVAEGEQAMGRIQGIVHSAGIIEGLSMRPVQDLTPADCHLQFAAKALGTLVLKELFADKTLDFCWLLSSISCVLGGLGFGAYAAANQFMDVFVRDYNNACQTNWFSLDWDGMDGATSTDAFLRMLHLKKIPQMVFANGGNLQKRIDQWVRLETVRSQAKEKPANTGYPRPELSTAYLPPQSQAEIEITDIWKEFLGFAEIGIHDDFLELGGNSLGAITVIARIHQRLGVNVPVPVFFENPTIAAIASYTANSTEKTVYAEILSVEKKDYYPLSAAQRRIFIQYTMDTTSKSYNNPLAVMISGNFSLEKLEQTFKLLIQRHESLRSSFRMTPSGPVQIIHDNPPFAVEYHECPASESPTILAQFTRPFDLEEPPLLRVGLIKTGERNFILMIDVYHIIYDGVTFNIMINEFVALYHGQELPPLKIQYKDFSEWQNGLYESGRMDAQKQYWLSRFPQGDIPVLNLPTDYPRPAVRDVNRGDIMDFNLDVPLIENLRTLVQNSKSTIPILLLAAYYWLLAKYSKQEDIIIGSLITGRSHADLENVIGMFVNVLPLRNSPRTDSSFSDFLDTVKKNSFAAYENQDYPIDELIANLKLQGETGRNPLFDVVFTFNTLDNPSRETADTALTSNPNEFEVELFGVKNDFAKFDLYLEANASDQRVSILLRYSTQLFKPSTIETLKKYYTEILQQVTANPDIRLADVRFSHDFLATKSRKQDEDDDFNL